MADLDIKALMAKHSRLLWAVAGSVLHRVGSAADIEECVADVFVQLWRNPSLYNPDRGTIKAFLATAAKTRALDRYRQLMRGKTVALDDETLPDDDDLLENICTQEGYQALYAAVNELTEPDREIIIRRYFLEQMPAEIAHALKTTSKQVQNRLYQAKLRLRKTLESIIKV